MRYFVRDSKSLMDSRKTAIAAARAGKLMWISYPKAGQLDTDLSRDFLWTTLKPFGISAVRQVSIDQSWTAMRFRRS